MRNVLIVDTETTGLDPAVDRVIEIGAILYSLEAASPLACVSYLLRSENATNPAASVNRIPEAALRYVDHLDVQPLAFRLLDEMAKSAACILAHNAAFDRSFLAGLGYFPDRPWICTKEDLAWPRQSKPGASLVVLALDHDLGVAYAHRALADCDLIARLLTRCHELGHDLPAMLERAARPKLTYRALVDYKRRELAKAHGFQWQPDAQIWARRIAPEDVEALALPFGVKVVQL
jgi:DNA polymerase-3 subunit epsilon